MSRGGEAGVDHNIAIHISLRPKTREIATTILSLCGHCSRGPLEPRIGLAKGAEPSEEGTRAPGPQDGKTGTPRIPRVPLKRVHTKGI